MKLVFHSSQSVANTFTVENVVRVVEKAASPQYINAEKERLCYMQTKTHIYSPQDLLHRDQRYRPKVCCEGLSDLSGAFVDC